MSYRPLTQIAHDKLQSRLRSGDWAIDATAGNGHDTLFLAQQVGDTGHVYAFDIQAQAIQSTTAHLASAGLDQRVTLCQASHADMLTNLPGHWQGRVAAIVFNLGYLPNGDKNIITQAGSTIAALKQSVCLLKPGGILSILAYRGHDGGLSEDEAVVGWLRTQADLLIGESIQSRGPVGYFYIKV